MTNKQTPWKTTVVDVQRLKNSRNGNPRYEIKTKDYCYVCSWKTPADCGWVYGINFDALEGKEVELEYHYTKTGRVVLDNIIVI
jgi:hypothetical protein